MMGLDIRRLLFLPLLMCLAAGADAETAGREGRNTVPVGDVTETERLPGAFAGSEVASPANRAGTPTAPSTSDSVLSVSGPATASDNVPAVSTRPGTPPSGQPGTPPRDQGATPVMRPVPTAGGQEDSERGNSNTEGSSPVPLRVVKPARASELLAAPLPPIPEMSGQPRPPSQESGQEDLILDEILVSSPSLEIAEEQRRRLSALGLGIKQRKLLRGLGLVLTVYRVPSQSDPFAVLDQLRELIPEVNAEFNRRFHLLGNTVSAGEVAHGREYARALVGLQPSDTGRGLTIAMLDAAVHKAHPALLEANLVVSDITDRENPPTKHGTAVASLLVGRHLVEGALPESQLLAVNIFSADAHGKQQTRSDWWLFGLNELLLAQPRPVVVNMSFGGGYSSLLAQAMTRLASEGMTLVAAAGNGGPESAVMFPASLGAVIAATAVDARRHIFAGAPASLTSPAVAAPGVDVWVADGENSGFYASGSSFASPWIASVMALARQGGYSAEDVLHAASDLGTPGFDPVFGAGLINRQ